MRLLNISRAEAEQMPWLVDNQHWLISIHSTGRPPANITAPFGKVFRFEFCDVVEPEPGSRPISPQQAREIAGIIRLAAASDVKCLWVHCDAGVCRSGAVVEAGLAVGFSTDDEICGGRVPNRLVFNEVAKALGLKWSWDELGQKAVEE